MKKKITTTTVVEEIIDDTPKNLSAYILLDRSGSMTSMWNEATGSVNGYVEELVKNKIKGNVTIALFDSNNPFEVVCEKTPFKDYKPSLKNYRPRGTTPLFDAVGQMITLAERSNDEKTVIVIMTDGEENASKEFNKTSIKNLVAKVTKKGWEVVFLGANFDVSKDAQSTGLHASKFSSSTVSNLAGTMRSFAARSSAYSGTSTVDPFTGKSYNAGQAFDITASDKAKSST